MAFIYIASLVLVMISVLFAVGSAVLSVSRKPVWATSSNHHLKLVKSEDRRENQLPFVGQDRRMAYRNQVNQQAQERKAA